MEGLLLAAKAALEFVQSIDGYENSVTAVNLRREIEAVEHSVHPTVATGCPFCGVSAEDIELLNESLVSDRNSG